MKVKSFSGEERLNVAVEFLFVPCSEAAMHVVFFDFWKRQMDQIQKRKIKSAV